MTTAPVLLAGPAPEVTTALAEAALAAFRQPVTVRYADLEALTRLGREPVDGELRAWAEQIATPAGFPLIGTGLSAQPYPALLWNGARLDAAAPDAGWAPLLAALAAADPDDDQALTRLPGALTAAAEVGARASRLLATAEAPVAWPTLASMTAAAAAHLTAAATPAAPVAPVAPGEGLARVLDLAASLTVLTPGEQRSAASGLWTGHGAASGWLATRLPTGITPMAGSVVHTLSAAAGGSAGPGRRFGCVADVLDLLR